MVDGDAPTHSEDVDGKKSKASWLGRCASMEAIMHFRRFSAAPSAIDLPT
jgi:hypothetical protein